MASALDIIRVVAEVVYLGQQVINVYHAISPSAIPDSDVVDDLSVQVDDAMIALSTGLDGSLAPGSIRILNVTQNEELALMSWPAFTGGTIGGAVGLPPGVAALVTQPTATLGSRGRKFIAGMTEGALSDGVWEGAFLTLLEAYASLVSAPFLGQESAEPWSWCVVTEAGIARPITGYQVGNIPAYQRRRKQGVGA